MKRATKEAEELAARAGRSLRRAAREARRIARAYRTPIYIWKDGKVVALKPKRR